MASIYLRKNFFWVSFTENGKRYQRSLRTKDRKIAKFKKNEIENRLSLGEPTTTQKKLSVKQIYREFLDHCAATLAVRTVEYYDEILLPFIRQLPENARFQEITDKAVIDYLNTKPNIKAGMTWHIIKVIKTFANFAAKRGYAKPGQLTVKKPKIQKRVPECWTAEEIKRVLDKASDPLLYGMIYVNLHIGLRPAELIRLDWSDIDFDNNHLTVREAKDSEFRHIMLHPAVIEYLKPLRKKSGQVFDGADSQYLRVTSRKLRKQAQMTHIKRFWYATRHTFATEYYKRTGDLRGLQEILGHSKIEMTTVYVNPQDDHQRQQINKLSYGI